VLAATLTPKPRRTRIGAYAILLDAGKVLLCRLSREVPSWTGYWTLPGGGLEFGESPEQAVVREVFEETGLHIRVTGLAGIDSVTASFEHEDVHSLRVIYHAEILSGTLRHELTGTTDLCAWHDLTAVADLPTVTLVPTALRLQKNPPPG
jgi:ADP-ribose pyrophosphatase YjhB (NUDIX family)